MNAVTKIFLLCALVLVALIPAETRAQSSRFAPAIKINEFAISYYEIDQRELMLQVLGTIGDLRKQAIGHLIDDRLQSLAAKDLGMTVSQEEVEAGMAEFAQRANLTTEQFITEIAKGGVEPETFRDFVASGLLWRKVIQVKFQSKALVSESDLDAAMALGNTAVGESALLSELILPLGTAQDAQNMQLAQNLSRQIRGFAAFEQAARTYSAAATAQQGGKLDWAPLANLPPQISTKLLALNIGEVTQPIQLPNAIALFQLRGLRAGRSIKAKTVSIDYIQFLIPGGRTDVTLGQARHLAGLIDTCNDFQALVTEEGAAQFSRNILPVRAIPSDVARELAQLDANETSSALVSGENSEFLVFLMLCGRTTELAEGAREEVRLALFNQRIEAFGQGFLQELKGDAIIIRK